MRPGVLTGVQPSRTGAGLSAIVGSKARTEVCAPVTRGLGGQGSFLAEDAGDRTKSKKAAAGASGKSAACMQGPLSQTALLSLGLLAGFSLLPGCHSCRRAFLSEDGRWIVAEEGA